MATFCPHSVFSTWFLTAEADGTFMSLQEWMDRFDLYATVLLGQDSSHIHCARTCLVVSPKRMQLIILGTNLVNSNASDAFFSYE